MGSSHLFCSYKMGYKASPFDPLAFQTHLPVALSLVLQMGSTPHWKYEASSKGHKPQLR